MLVSFLNTMSHEAGFRCTVTWVYSRLPRETSCKNQRQILIESKSPPRYAMGQPVHMFQLCLSDTGLAQGRGVHLKSGSRFASHSHSHMCSA